MYNIFSVFFFQAEDGIRDLVRSRGLGDVYKRQVQRLKKEFNLSLSFQAIRKSLNIMVNHKVLTVKDLSLIHI